VGRSFLESTFLTACPTFRPAWDTLRRSYGAEPDAAAFLEALRHHVVGLASVGRAAEFSRFAQTLDRLLADADPILEDLLHAQLVGPLAAAVRGGEVAPAMIEPHLGARTRVAWRRHAG
jgi:hypothetical protein